MDSHKEVLLDGFEELGFKLSKEQIKQFYDYTELLLDWNKKINLTRITNIKDIFIKHFLDACSPLPYLIKKKYLKEGFKYLDLGSGAGIPGIPIKIVFPQLQFYLSEVKKKRYFS